MRVSDLADYRGYAGSVTGPELVAPGRAAERQHAVVYRGDHETLEDGVARAVRAHARALNAAGIPVSLHSISHMVRHPDAGLVRAMDDLIRPEVHEEVGALRYRTVGNVALTIHHVVVASGDQLEGLIVPREVRFDGGERHMFRRAIVYLAWERTTVHQSLVDVLGRCAALWVPCTRNKRVFVKAGVPAERVHVVPHPYRPDSLIGQCRARRKRLPSGARFYSIGKWEPRKNHHGLIGAFLRTFRHDDEYASLTLKTSSYGKWDGYPESPAESVLHWIKDPLVQQNGWTAARLAVCKRVQLITAMLSEDRLAKLHALHNIYVSASFAEGFDLPAFDARCIGNRLVYVPFGGPEDFAGDWDTPVEVHGLAPVPRGYGWEEGAAWAQVEVDALGTALAAAARRASHEPGWVDARFSEETVGRLMAKQILRMCETVEPDAAAAFRSGGAHG